MADNSLGTANERRSTRTSKRVAAKAPVLPSARAAVGALMCVLAALLTFVAYRQAQKPPTTTYLIAAREMEPGAPLTLADVREEAITLPAEVAARSFSSFAQLENAFLLGPIQQGELLQASNLVRHAGGTGGREWSFSIEAVNAAGGRIRIGERIQILGSSTKDGEAKTEVVNPNALVIGIDRSDVNPARGTLLVVLALDSDEQVLQMEIAKKTLELTVVRGIGNAPKTPASTPGTSNGTSTSKDTAVNPAESNPVSTTPVVAPVTP